MFCNDLSKSLIRSSWCSNPIDNIITASPAPEYSLCSLFSCLCVVEAGCIIKDFVSPTFAKWENKVQFSTAFFAPSKPLFTVKVKTEPKPKSKYLFAKS